MNQPDQDGVTHINIYSRAKTTLGRALSNWADMPVDHPEGRFRTIEGYWFYLLDPQHEKTWKEANGFTAKTCGKRLEHAPRDQMQFQSAISGALRRKLEQHPDLAKALRESSLPLDHYYVYGGRPVSAGYSWITEIWERLRAELKEAP